MQRLFRLLIPALLFVPLYILIVALHNSPSATWLSTLRLALSGSHYLALVLQFYLLFAVELLSIYSIIINRRGEVFVFSHARLWLAILLAAIAGVAGYRVVVWLITGRTIVIYILFAAITMFIGTGLVGMVQATFVVIVDAMGRDPFIKDAARPEEVGKIGDCNSWVVRRWGQFVWLWFLLIPGLVIQAPLPEWLIIVLLIPCTFVPLYGVGHSMTLMMYE